MNLHTTRKIKQIPFLETYLAPEMDEARRDGVRLFAGWGAKASGRRARAWASLLNGRAVQLEDGFLRSYGTGQTHPPISLVADGRGIYYDATRPSDLEVMLEQEGPLWSHEGMPNAEQAEEALAQVLANGLSKYNHAPKYVSSRSATRGEKRVLVIDQTAGDLSIKLGLAGPESFKAMLAAARAEHPGAKIYVKTHPMVSSGRKSGHFHWLAEDDKTIKLTDPVEPMSLIQEMDHVYVVSSTMGFEALMAGKPVTCFGMPWYAGWGITDDRVNCPRRTAKRDLLELFAAAYMRYCRYIDPVMRSAGDIFHAIRWLAMQKESERHLHSPSLRGRLIGFSMRRWKQANLAPILGTLPQTVCFARGERELRKLRPVPEDCLACWGAEIPAEVGAVAEESGARPLRIEDGFIRSVGLGSDLIPPQSLVLDKKGIYFDPTKASGLEEILEHTEFTQADLDEARLVRQLIVDNGVTKYNMETRAFPEWENVEAQKVLVVGQVEDDASIRLGCTDIRTNLGLLQAVREQHPEAFVIYKPHPDVWTGNRVGTIAKEQALALADHVETMTSITSCIDASNALHTLTSLSGFDALLRGLEVVTYGQPFYAGWGLTKDLAKDAPALSRRTRRLTLDQLVAGTLLHYPIYWDPVLRGYTTARAVIRQLVERRSSLEASGKLEKLGTGYVSRQLRKTSILAKALLR